MTDASQPVFADYARIYDAIYADKPYRDEAIFVCERLRSAQGDLPATLLEIGAGTGRHLSEFLDQGITVLGVDRSPEMLAIARSRLAEHRHGEHGQLQAGDLCKLGLGRTFAAAVSLFHVMSYLCTTADLIAGFTAVRRHVVVGAPFFFDFWHLSGVRTDPPQTREREIPTPLGMLRRRVTPHWREPNVDLDISITGGENNAPVAIREQHRMRAWSTAELTQALEQTGFQVEAWGARLDPEPLRERDWLGWALARAY